MKESGKRTCWVYHVNNNNREPVLLTGKVVARPVPDGSGDSEFYFAGDDKHFYTNWYDTEQEALDSWFERVNEELLRMQAAYSSLHSRAVAVQLRLIQLHRKENIK